MIQKFEAFLGGKDDYYDPYAEEIRKQAELGREQGEEDLGDLTDEYVDVQDEYDLTPEEIDKEEDFFQRKERERQEQDEERYGIDLEDAQAQASRFRREGGDLRVDLPRGETEEEQERINDYGLDPLKWGAKNIQSFEAFAQQ